MSDIMISSLKKVRDSIQTAQADGVEQAIALLADCQCDVATENQTWDSAIAMLRIFHERVKEKNA